MTTANHAEDSQVILLLCSTLGLPRSADADKPLSKSEWNTVARAIDASEFKRPAAVLGLSAADLARGLRLPIDLSERITKLLDRGAQLAIERDRLAGLGIWTLTRADEQYPRSLKERLRRLAPPVLFGAGPIETLSRQLVAVVGSRDIDQAGTTFARTLGERCAKSGLAVISGAARGADRAAMNGALEGGGYAAGVLAESLEQTIRQRETRTFVLQGCLTVLTPAHPAARFSAGGAMGRNKLIYALSSWAVVDSAALETGGTWAGAIENLDAQWTPLFVRDDGAAPEGNRQLLARGGRPFALHAIHGSLADWFEQYRSVSPGSEASLLPESSPAPYGSNNEAGASNEDLFEELWPRFADFLRQPRTPEEFAAAYQLDHAQAKTWLTRAVTEGKATKLARPLRYHAAVSQTGQKDLFS